MGFLSLADWAQPSLKRFLKLCSSQIAKLKGYKDYSDSDLRFVFKVSEEHAMWMWKSLSLLPQLETTVVLIIWLMFFPTKTLMSEDRLHMHGHPVEEARTFLVLKDRNPTRTTIAWTILGLGVPTCHAPENPCITLPSFLKKKKNLLLSGPVQFKPVQLKGQLYK